MTPIRRPPILAIGHQRGQVRLYSVEVKRLKRLSIVKVGVHWIARRLVLMKHLQVQLVWPPIAIPTAIIAHIGHRAMNNRAFTASISVHNTLHHRSERGFIRANLEEA